jgi:Zn-dependent protease
VFFLEPGPTAFDFHFRLFGVPVRVHPMFWLISAILGFDLQREGFLYLVLWVGLVFVSILLHEFGHVVAGRIFGARGHIVLYSFGGLAIGSSNLRSRWQRVVVFFAGPLAQLALYGVLWFLFEYQKPAYLRQFPMLWQVSIRLLEYINLYWALLNLLPIWPLDGGRISREVFEAVMPGRGTRFALGVSLLVSGVIAVNALVAMNRGKPLVPYLPTGGGYTVFLFAMLALGSYQAMNQLSAANPWGREGAPWERDPDAWKR